MVWLLGRLPVRRGGRRLDLRLCRNRGGEVGALHAVSCIAQVKRASADEVLGLAARELDAKAALWRTCGAIGAKLEALGVSVAGITRHGVFAGGKKLAKPQLAKLLKSADWFVMALPSTTGTDDFLSASTMAKLPRRCVVVNVGRGNAIDERALYRALKSRRLAGACLDVRRHEPSATVLETPGYVPELADLPNCVVMPHTSAFSPRYLRRCFDELRDEGFLDPPCTTTPKFGTIRSSAKKEFKDYGRKA